MIGRYFYQSDGGLYINSYIELSDDVYLYLIEYVVTGWHRNLTMSSTIRTQANNCDPQYSHLS
jgi:hypothetical protein